jgi:hypothetical protein
MMDDNKRLGELKGEQRPSIDGAESEEHSLRFNLGSAQEYARAGRLEAWLHGYLNSGDWKNPGLSEGLKLQKRWWKGPVEIEIKRLSRVVGPEEGMEYRENPQDWQRRIGQMVQDFEVKEELPPLIVEYRKGDLSVRDGSHRLAAMEFLGWTSAWVIIWYNCQEDYLEHAEELRATGYIDG